MGQVHLQEKSGARAQTKHSRGVISLDTLTSLGQPTIGTLSKATLSTGRGGQFFQLISLLPGNTYQLKELAATSC